ncbi:uncharacterized protein BDZ83DRAFT_20492 [Colletotrichum acutatum]|uniref:Uncharacterized protein n=1 Tax=Glomerella acutata TaxID=27357 RepID=A0AAD8UGI4_GLOAC|nr:uncharacterized protein BDZ83DRAFT_20492 [Colletotrichum acutatum]KAK1718116.1 hypothetical protein BDZ83DRAFT_20492 [Colletotrichum acutatum]
MHIISPNLSPQPHSGWHKCHRAISSYALDVLEHDVSCDNLCHNTKHLHHRLWPPSVGSHVKLVSTEVKVRRSIVRLAVDKACWTPSKACIGSLRPSKSPDVDAILCVKKCFRNGLVAPQVNEDQFRAWCWASKHVLHAPIMEAGKPHCLPLHFRRTLRCLRTNATGRPLRLNIRTSAGPQLCRRGKPQQESGVGMENRLDLSVSNPLHGYLIATTEVS